MTYTHPKTLFVYWGRKGAISQLCLEIASALHQSPELPAFISMSIQNEIFPQLARYSDRIWPFATFSTWLGAIAKTPAFLWRGARLVRNLRQAGFTNVVVLMPHIWTPILGFLCRRAGLNYCVVIHDVEPHPGDPTAIVNAWLNLDLAYAKYVFALSDSVRDKLLKRRAIDSSRVVRAFLPDLRYGAPAEPRKSHEPFRLLFFGRLLKYKGLGVLIEAVELLRESDIRVQIGVVGEGRIEASDFERLRNLNAEIINRWVDHSEIHAILERYDAVVAPYLEASQSAVVAMGLAAALPVIATPVGALPEQIQDGITGLVTRDTSAGSVAEKLKLLVSSPSLYARLVHNLRARQSRSEASAERLISEILSQLEDLTSS